MTLLASLFGTESNRIYEQELLPLKEFMKTDSIVITQPAILLCYISIQNK
jgi:hypothetical protein